jgi:uncharacterized protein DUF6491
MKNMLALALVAVLAGGCATGMSRTRGDQVMDRYEPYLGEPIRSFTAFHPQNWQPVNRNQLIVWTSMNDAYLLTIWDNCPELMYKNAVRVSSTGSQISTFDHVIVGRDSCPISKIQPIDMRAYRQDRDAAKRDS